MIVKELLLSLGIQVDTPAFRAADASLTGLVTRAKQVAAAVGAYKVASFVSDAVHEVVATGAAVNDLSQKIGVGVAELQELGYAFALSGVSQEQFTVGMSFLTKTAAEAAQGNKTAADTFSQFGIALRGADGQVRTSDKLLGDIADRMAKAATQTERYGIATSFFGARNGNFAILLKDGAGAVEALRKEAQELGFVIGDDLVASLDAADDDLVIMNFAIQGLKVTFVREFLPAIIAGAKFLVKAMKGARVAFAAVADAVRTTTSWIYEHRVALLTILGIVAFLKVSFWLFAAALWGVNLGFIGAGAAGVASGLAVAAAWLAAKVQVLALYALVGGIAAVFVIVALVIAAVVEEIVAMFTKTDGLFEKMAGKWGDLSAKLWENADFANHPLLAFLRTILSVITFIISGWDRLFGAVFKGIELFDEFLKGMDIKMGADGQSLVDEQGNIRSVTSSNGYVQPSAATRAATTMAPSTRVDVSVEVDASGQSLNEEQVSGLISSQVDQTLERHLSHGMRALTPASAGG